MSRAIFCIGDPPRLEMNILEESMLVDVVCFLIRCLVQLFAWRRVRFLSGCHRDCCNNLEVYVNVVDRQYIRNILLDDWSDVKVSTSKLEVRIDQDL